MADAFLIFAILAGLVAVAVVLVWDSDLTFREAVRHARVEAQRDARAAEDAAWADYITRNRGEA